jgi:hypothetical protein
VGDTTLREDSIYKTANTEGSRARRVGQLTRFSRENISLRALGQEGASLRRGGEAVPYLRA